MKIHYIFWALGLLWVSAANAQGGIFRCERNGVVSFTNIEAEAKGCKRVAAAPRQSKAPSLSDKVAEQSFPRIDGQTQKKRDASRDDLIRKELDEQKLALEGIVNQLTHFDINQNSDQQKQINTFKALNEERRMRAKSIAELEKQLGISAKPSASP